MLTDQSLAWLRDLHADAPDPADGDIADRLHALARQVPAWNQPFSTLLGRPVEVEVSCPQIVGVEFPTMALRRAEWIRGNLHLSLAPLLEDPNVFTSFRIVGAEPRNWDVHGIEDATFELTMSGVNVRVPMIRADIELIRGSY